MIFKWESEEEKLLKFMRLGPKKKLEWLRDMQEFLSKAFNKRQRNIYYRLRENR